MEKNANITGRLPKRSESGPAMKFTNATPKRYPEIVYWVVLLSVLSCSCKSVKEGTILTWTSIYVPANRESVRRWGLVLVIKMSLGDYRSLNAYQFCICM